MKPDGTFITQRGTNCWQRRVGIVGLIGWWLAAIPGSGLSPVQAEGTQDQSPSPKPSLHGAVWTTNREPIANATVTIKAVLAGRGAVYVRDAPDCNRQVRTKADGSFAFQELVADTKFEGVVTAPGYEPFPFWRADPRGEPLEIKLLATPTGEEPRQTLRGRVVNAEGEPLEGARIQVYMIHTERDWHSGGGWAFTDKEGDFVFRAGENFIDCDFRLEAEGYVTRSFSGARSGEDATEYTLSPGTSVTGRVVRDGKPLPDAAVGLYGLRDNGFLTSLSAVTDGNGHFTFRGVPAHEEFYFFGIMRSLRELGALPRRQLKTGEAGSRLDLGDLNLVQGYTVAGRVQMANGRPTPVGALTLARTVLTPKSEHAPTAQEESNRSFYGLEHSFDNWRSDPGADGKFEFTGVPGETVSIFLMLKPFDMLSPRNASSDGKGFRLLGLVVSNKTDLVLELEPHRGQVFPPARDFEVLSRRPLEGAETVIAR